MTDDSATTTGSTDIDSDLRTDVTSHLGRLREAGEIIGKSSDPMASHEAELRRMREATSVDFFAAFLESKAEAGKRPGTIRDYRACLRQWKAHMAEQDRHPAAPAPEHVRSFITYHRETLGNKVATTGQKVHHLRRVFEWLAAQREIPFGADDLPKFSDIVREYDFEREADKPVHHMNLSDVRAGVRRLTHLRDRAIVVLQFKLGLRQGEVRNIKLQDISLTDRDLKAHFPDLGANDLLRDREGNVPRNALVIPSKYFRPGNKSSIWRVLPLDREVRYVLVNYLLMRPCNDKNWLFLGKTHHARLDDEDVLNRVWRSAFPRDEWGETENYRAVTSHYGRFWFTNYWNKSHVMDREDIQYMRGDTGSGEDGPPRVTIDSYIWRDFPDIADKYLDHVFSLGL